MAPSARVVVFETDEGPNDWRRFVAALCFMQFYVQLVLGGTLLWTQGLLEHHQGGPAPSFWVGCSNLVLAVVMYLCGRSLWYRGRFQRGWLLAATLALLGCQATQTIEYNVTSWDSHPLFPWTITHHWLRILLYNLDMLPWLAVLVVSLWWEYCSSSRRPIIRRPRWVLAAMVWSLAAAMTTPANTPVLLYFTYALWERLDTLGVLQLALPLASLPALLTATFLLTGAPLARISAIALATAEIATRSVYALAFSRMNWASVVAMLATARHHGWDPLPYPFGFYLVNRDFFEEIFVQLVTAAGPWILIAVYVRRAPMRLPPEDGSPYPRRYCGHCGYNLYGITSALCPECGYRLLSPSSGRRWHVKLWMMAAGRRASAR